MEQLNKLFYKDSDGALIVYDVTNEESYNRVGYWIQELRSHVPHVKLVLLGNKCDLVSERKVPTDKAKAFARDNKMYFFEVSAKENSDENI